LDISSIKGVSYGESKFCVLIVDDYTNYCWSIFLKNKSKLKEEMFALLTDLKIAGIDIKHIRRDDSGENKAFYDACCTKGYTLRLSSEVQELLSETERWNGSFKHSMAGLEPC
jgi:hypothetical protein